MISRIPSTQFHDGIIDPVDGDDLDRFALDGQRLILKTPTSGVYLTNGAVFETENFSNIKITYLTASPNNYFLVEYPDGSTAKYGNQINSQNATSYAITEWKNAVGIPINYYYTLSSNNLLISSIAYGDNNSATQINNVVFEYIPRLRQIEKYVSGTLIVNNKIISKITSSTNGSNFRSYDLIYDITTYSSSINLGYQRLNRITESTTENGTIKKLNPTVFQYANTSETLNFGNIATNLSVGNIGSNNSVSISGDYDGDGKMDL